MFESCLEVSVIFKESARPPWLPRNQRPAAELAALPSSLEIW